jgi:hypothetical protein
MWITMGTIAAVALGIGIYLAVGAMRNGATFLEVLPPVSLLVFGIALAAGLLVLEGEIFPALKYNVAGVNYYFSMGLPSIVSIAVCMGIANLWGRVFGKKAEKSDPE